MQPFNLEKALVGAKVQTRTGLEATQVYLFTGTTSVYPIRAVINGSINSFTIEGKYYKNEDSSPLDLVMAPEPLEAWLVVLPDISGKSMIIGTTVHKCDPSDHLNSLEKAIKIRIDPETLRLLPEQD